MFKNSHKPIEQTFGQSLDVLTAALEYARQGIAVFPLHNPTADGSCSCRKADCGSLGKHPRTPNGVKAATTSEKKSGHGGPRGRTRTLVLRRGRSAAS